MWKFDDVKLRKLYKESKESINMSYEEFKKMAEQYANQLIENAKKESKDAKEAIGE